MRFVGQVIERYLGDINGPGEGSVSVALILFVIPRDVCWWLICTRRFQWTKLCDMFAARALELCRRVSLCQRTAGDQRLLQAQYGRLDQFADDHRVARGDGRSTVGHISSIRLYYFDQVVVDAECFAGYLGKDGVSTLTYLSAGGQYLHPACGSRFGADD